MLDAGWFHYLSTNANDWMMKNPPSIGGEYMATHISPIFLLTTWIADTIGIKITAIFFSAFLALFFGLIGVAYYLFLAPDKSPNPIVWPLLALFAALNGVSLSIIGYPHTEIAIPACFLMFLALELRGRHFIAAIFFVLGLAFREDAGGHYALYLGLLVLHLFVIKAPNLIRMLCYCLVAAAYSLLAMFFQKQFLPGGDDAFARIYSGYPPFSHVTLQYVIESLSFYSHHKLYVFIPILIYSFVAVWKRDFVIAIPVLATLPWTFLSTMAVSGAARELAIYYVFPYLILLLWPAFVYRLRQPKHENRKLMLILSLILPFTSILFFKHTHGNNDPRPWKKMNFSYVKKVTATEDSLNCFLAENDFSNIIIDDAAASLRPNLVTRRNWRNQLEFSDEDLKDYRGILMKEKSWIVEKKEDIAERGGFWSHCRLMGTDFIFRHRPQDNPKCCAATGW